MNINQIPNGVYAASLTPVKEDFSIDFEEFSSHGKHLLENGCNGLVIFGTTGEATSFSTVERKKALEKLLEEDLPANSILLGTGTSSMTETIDLTRHAISLGVNNILMLPPYYYKAVNTSSLFHYFEEIIRGVNSPLLRLFLYHIPQISGVPISHDLINLLVKKYGKLIAGVKDSSGDWNNMKSLNNMFSGLRIFPGSEKFLLKMTEIGGPGCISSSTNITHRLAAKVWAMRNDTEAQKLQDKLSIMRVQLENFPMIAILKYYRYKISGNPAWLNIRPPLEALSESQKKTADNLFEHLKSEI